MKMKNTSDWETKPLKEICKRVIDHTDNHTDRTIRIETSKASYKNWRWKNQTKGLYSGRASMNSRRKLYIGVPKAKREIGEEEKTLQFNKKQFARVLEHEILHNQGVGHREMRDDIQATEQEIEYEIDDIEVKPKD